MNSSEKRPIVTYFNQPRHVLAPTQLQAVLQQLQKQAEAEIAGEPIFIKLWVLYDGSFKIILHTFDGDEGWHESHALEDAFQEAFDMLSGMRQARLDFDRDNPAINS